MSYAFVFFIEVDGVVGVDLPHKQREVSCSGFQEYMIMVIHQAIVMYVYSVYPAGFAEYLQKLLFIIIASVDIGACYSPVDNMMKTIKIHSRLTCYAFSLPCFCREKYSVCFLMVASRHLALKFLIEVVVDFFDKFRCFDLLVCPLVYSGNDNIDYLLFR